MSDQYEHIRSLPFAWVAGALGIDLSLFKTRKGKHGPELYGPCPIHKPKNNHTSFSYAEAGLWHCFSCNKHGKGAIDLIKEMRGGGFQDAVSFLQVIEPIKPPIASPGADSGVLEPYKGSYEKYKVPCPWLENRIPDQAVRERYGVFCYNNPARKSAYSNRVMIPVKSIEGNLHGYLGRAFAHTSDNVPKYLFPKGLEKSKFLFGVHELSEGRPHRIVYLVESPFCVMKFASLGLRAVAAYGWSVSAEQIILLQTLAKGIVFVPDRNKSLDCAGVVQSLAQALWVRFPPLPDGIDDPEQLTAEQIQHL